MSSCGIRRAGLLQATNWKRGFLDYCNTFVLTASPFVTPFTLHRVAFPHLKSDHGTLLIVTPQCLQDEAQTP